MQSRGLDGPQQGGGSKSGDLETITAKAGDFSIRGSKARGLFAVGLFTLVGLYALFAGFSGPDHSLLGGFLIILAGVAFGSWIVCHHISVRGDVLRYSVPLRRAVQVRLSEVTKMGYEVGDERYRDRFRPFMRLVVVAETPGGRRKFDIALKPFRREDIRRFHQLLHERGLLGE
jgi:hypothetical protein